MYSGARVGPYEIVSRLGAGGMGEVWRARDERLGRDVAIKVLPAAFAADPERLARFEREARATAALSHPNVLAIFDVGVHDGQPYLVEELLEGESLRVRLLDGPLPVREALSLGVQIARGLAAAHDKRIVHRDLKPDNVVVTSDGVPKILDFGLAKIVEPASGDAATLTQAPSAATGPGQVMGSAAYMAPEQARGLAVDHRADLFAFGVLLHELLSGERPFRGQTHSDIVAAILKDEPEQLPEGIPAPVRALVRRCLEKRPEDRFQSARDLGFALQALIEGTPQAAAKAPEPERPYPGLAAFGEGDAKRFFGRDEEVAALWRKLPGRSLLALIGPSGVGKTSFIRAGLVPHAPAGWRCIVATPGQAPFAALARALAPSFTGDAEAVPLLVDFLDHDTAVRLVERWRQRFDHGLIVVDQFEELFTLNPEDVQSRFAELLGRLAHLDGVHVLLSMRDDFFFSCYRFAPLGEVFEGVNPLGPPSVQGLRQALVEPAKAMGFAFEDEALVDEMVHAVEGERGALPMLAFAAASLWVRRDLEARKLTRAAYESIGGVAGALAQHAEATLDRVGADKLPLVRELFRNLVTSQQTRCVLDVEELVSVFPNATRAEAREVLARLVDARLLTEYEVDGTDGLHHRRVELVHESLLTAWPRLVRWRTEDDSSSQLRDQLRQAAHLWEEKGRSDDLLWTGTAYQEYQVWRSRYPGGLSELEETFGRAMAAAAGRKRRRRRIAVAALVAALAAGLAIVGSFWQRTLSALTRSDASKLVALGRAVGVEDDPTAAVAYAIASLERADSGEARMLALEAMAHGPVAFIAANGGVQTMRFSDDGRWLVGKEAYGNDAWVWASNGTRTSFPVARPGASPLLSVAPGKDILLEWDREGEALATLTFAAWSLPDGRKLVEGASRLPARWWVLRDPPRFAIVRLDNGRAEVREVPADPSVPTRLASYDLSAFVADWPTYVFHGVEGHREVRPVEVAIDPRGRWLAVPAGRAVVLQPLAPGTPARRLAQHEADVVALAASPDGELIAARDVGGSIRVWSVPSGVERARLEVGGTALFHGFSPDGGAVWASRRAQQNETGRASGSVLVWRVAPGAAGPCRTIALTERGSNISLDRAVRWVGLTSFARHAEIWDLAAPVDALPISLRRGVDKPTPFMSFHPAGTWVATGDTSEVALRPLGRSLPHVLAGHANGVNTVVFAPDGSYLMSAGKDRSMRLWPLTGDPPAPSRQLLTANDGLNMLIDLATVPDGSLWGVSSSSGQLALVPSGGTSRKIEAFSGGFYGVAISHDGLLVAVGGTLAEEARIRVLDVATGREVTVLDAGDRLPIYALAFMPDGTLAAGGNAGLRLWNLANRTFRTLWAPPSTDDSRVPVQFVRSCAVSRLLFAYGTETIGSAYLADVLDGSVHRLDRHGDRVFAVAIDPTGTIVATGSSDGIVRVGPASGGEPHLLVGHASVVRAVAISPDGAWLASGGDDTTVRLWPVPDLSKPPAHTLPLSELLAKLEAQTNLRVVADPAAPGGYRTEPGPFPGWAVVPEWQP